jgi:hypothetical protein
VQTEGFVVLRWLRKLAGRARRKLRSVVRRISPATTASPAQRSDAATSAPARQKRRDITKAYPRESTANLYDAVDYLRSREFARQNEAVLQRVRGRIQRGEPLRVTFLVNDRSKWNGTPLVEEMRGRGWDVGIALCLTDARGLDAAGRHESYTTEREFFSRIDPELQDLYVPETDNEVPIETLDTDVIFYQQPWGMKSFPRRMAGRALNAYMHYGFIMMANHGMHYNIGTFHSYLWRYFTQTEEHRLMHLAHDPSAHDRLVVTGYPKLDAYRAIDPTERIDHPLWGPAEREAIRVIFAPHHSLGKDNLRMSTFRWTAAPMLALAREHPEVRWVYKPHPTLKHSVVKNSVMSRDEYRAYEASWGELPNAAVYDSGEYFDLFRSSDVLVTDCGSFLAEYLPTGNPIIWLVQEGSIGLNPVGQALAAGFYEVRDIETFQAWFASVVLRGEDPLAAVRAKGARTLFPTVGTAPSSSVAVADHLASALS